MIEFTVNEEGHTIHISYPFRLEESFGGNRNIRRSERGSNLRGFS